mgnify:FL=1
MKQITADISFYPLDSKYLDIVNQFLTSIHDQAELKIETTDVSTLITGEYDSVMSLIEEKLRSFLESGDAVFVIKLSNACGKY